MVQFVPWMVNLSFRKFLALHIFLLSNSYPTVHTSASCYKGHECMTEATSISRFSPRYHWCFISANMFINPHPSQRNSNLSCNTESRQIEMIWKNHFFSLIRGFYHRAYYSTPVKGLTRCADAPYFLASKLKFKERSNIQW